MRTISDKILGKIRIKVRSVNFLSENRAVYEIMWKNIVEPGRSQMNIWRTRIACWMIKLQTHTQNM